MSPYEVIEYKVLKNKKNKDEALLLLKKVANQVQPIMYKYKWTVKLLEEFYPSNISLLGLNVNRGSN